MKKLLTIIFLIGSLSIQAQEKKSPTIVILNSQETIIPTELDSIAKTYVKKGLSKQEKENIKHENGTFKFKSKKEIEFLEEQDITTDIPFGLNYYLSYRFYEYFQNLLIYPARESNQSDVKSLQSISKKHDVNWVVNIKKVEFIVIKGQYSAKVDFQLYNQKTNQILLEKQINADDSSPGLEFTCETGTLSCVFNNSISKMSFEIIRVMGKNKEYWR